MYLIWSLERHEWIEIEHYITHPTDIIVLLGETLQRTTNHKLKGAIHRVGKASKVRTNHTFEFRSRESIYYPWTSEENNNIVKKYYTTSI